MEVSPGYPQAHIDLGRGAHTAQANLPLVGNPPLMERPSGARHLGSEQLRQLHKSQKARPAAQAPARRQHQSGTGQTAGETALLRLNGRCFR